MLIYLDFEYRGDKIGVKGKLRSPRNPADLVLLAFKSKDSDVVGTPLRGGVQEALASFTPLRAAHKLKPPAKPGDCY